MNRYGHHPARRPQSPPPPAERPPDGAVTCWDRRALAPVAALPVTLIAVVCADCARLVRAEDALRHGATGEWHCRRVRECDAAGAGREVGRSPQGGPR